MELNNTINAINANEATNIEEVNLENDTENSVEEDTDVKRPEGYTGKLIASPLKAIHEHCLECSNYSRTELKLCPCTSCPLYPYRFGKSEYRKGTRTMSDEQKKAVSERTKKLIAEGKMGRKKKNS